jgi:hypothetical protein
VPEPAYDFEADMDPALLYAFDQEAQWSPDPGPEPEREAVPPPGDDAELAYAFDDQSEWVGEPEVFVSPRR